MQVNIGNSLIFNSIDLEEFIQIELFEIAYSSSQQPRTINATNTVGGDEFLIS